MNDEENPEVSAGEYFADIAVRLVERDLLAGEAWRVAYAVGAMLDYLVDTMADDEATEDAQTRAMELLMETVNTLLYAHVHVIPGQQDIDTQAGDFAAMLDRAEEIRKNKHEPKEEDNPNGNS